MITIDDVIGQLQVKRDPTPSAPAPIHPWTYSNLFNLDVDTGAGWKADGGPSTEKPSC